MNNSKLTHVKFLNIFQLIFFYNLLSKLFYLLSTGCEKSLILTNSLKTIFSVFAPAVDDDFARGSKTIPSSNNIQPHPRKRDGAREHDSPRRSARAAADNPDPPRQAPLGRRRRRVQAGEILRRNRQSNTKSALLLPLQLGP